MTRLNRVAVQLVKGYQRFISPLLPWACRFSPTCSEYARQVLLLHGIGRGSWLAGRRLLRCHPFHSGGYDPPPLASAKDTRRPWKSG